MAEKGLTQRKTLAILLVVLVLVSVSGFFFLRRASAPEAFTLHWSDEWRDAGAVDGLIFFRDGNTLSAFDQKGLRWKKDVTPEALIAYGTSVVVWEGDTLFSYGAQEGTLQWEVEMAGVRALDALPSEGNAPNTIVAIKADRFLLVNGQDGSVDFVQHTSGTPDRFVQSATWRAWTETGTSPRVQSEGELATLADLSPLMTAHETSRTVLSATPWEVTALPSARADENEATPSPSALSAAQKGILPAFRAPTMPVQALLATGDDSFVAWTEGKLLFIHNGVMTRVLPSRDVVDLAGDGEGCVVLFRDALVRYDAAGDEEERVAIDFEPQALVQGETSTVVAGMSQALVLSEGTSEMRETGEFVRKLVPAHGAPLLIYRETVVPVA